VSTAAAERELKTERRDRLDGGLNTRGTPLLVRPDQAEAISDFRPSRTGGLVHRRYALLKLQTTWVAAGALSAPVLTRLAGSGSLPAGTYTAAYFLAHIAGSSVDLAGRSAYSAPLPGILLNDRIQIDIFPNNLGEGQGQGADGADDPFAGGPVAYSLSGVGLIELGRSPDTPGAIVLSTAFAWNSGSRVRRAVVSAYPGTPAATPDNAGNFPLRAIFWHSGIQRMLGWTVDRAVCYAADLASFSRFALGVDKAGNTHLWSRIPTPLQVISVDGFAIAWDGVGRPKRLNWTGDPTTSTWRLLGANPPAAAPTLAVVVGGGALSAGIYKYVCTFRYRHTRGNSVVTASLTTADIESNSSAVATSPATALNDRITVTLPATSPESGHDRVYIYRTLVDTDGPFFYVTDVANGTATVTDGAADSDIAVNDQPPDGISRDPNTIPPNKLDFLTLFAGRIWAVEMQYLTDTSGRIIGTVGTSRVIHTKRFRRNDLDVDQCENIDAWPFDLFVGGSEPITGMLARNGRLYVFKATEIYVIAGTVDDGDLTVEGPILTGVGAMRDSIIQRGPSIYFWDQAAGPQRFDGAGYEPIGLDIQPTWDADRDAGFYPRAVFADPRNREVHWCLTNLSLAPGTQIDQLELRKEYVYDLPTKGWFPFTSLTTGSLPYERSINCGVQGVQSTNTAKQIYDTFICDQRGRLMIDDATTGTSAESIRNALVQLRHFFGSDWDMIKIFRILQLYGDLAAGTMTVNVALLSAQPDSTVSGSGSAVPFRTLGTVDGLMGNNVVNEVVRALPFRSELITRPGVGGTFTCDRAILVQVTTSTPLMKLNAASLKYKDQSDITDKV
jgi:hypothetical protein